MLTIFLLLVITFLIFETLRTQRLVHAYHAMMLLSMGAAMRDIKPDRYISSLALAVGSEEIGKLDRVIFHIYKHNGLTPPKYALIDDRLQKKLVDSYNENLQQIRASFKQLEEDELED